MVAHFACKVKATDMWRSLGHDLVDFFARAWPPLYSSPSLCKQSESHEHVAMSEATAW